MPAKSYFGPAGLFSTDDPLMDRLQIEAEQYEEPYDGEPENPLELVRDTIPDEPVALDSYVAGCPDCDWYEFDQCGSEETDMKAMTTRMEASHTKRSSDCQGKISISLW